MPPTRATRPSASKSRRLLYELVLLEYNDFWWQSHPAVRDMSGYTAAPLLLVLWLPKEAVTRFAQKVPDLWAWCTAVLDFALTPPSEHLDIHDHALAFRGEDAERLRNRRREIADYLQPGPSGARGW